MAKVEQQLCDACGRVLTGKVGIEMVRRAALLMKGQIGTLEVDPGTKWREHTYITPAADCDLSFCMEAGKEYDCLSLYVETHKFIANQRRRDKLSEEAALEHRNRQKARGWEAQMSKLRRSGAKI